MLAHGGLYIDVDMIILRHDMEELIDFKNSSFIGVQEYLSPMFQSISDPYLANGFFACSPNHSIMKRCINLIPFRVSSKKSPVHITTGPGLLNNAIYYGVNVVPTHWIFPQDFHFKTKSLTPEDREKSIFFTLSSKDNYRTEDVDILNIKNNLLFYG
jgi:hypothetical protein